ncbi:uncharacterized protein A4U43_C10F14530 [Asparagus officinalis]|uniref:Uncharacterized protein n=2 Tax=Asparagus officinalis TaxID=4686 RepID=A0A5P1E361_ASPOF|nr:uncharacterized protein A4U43_C10F14530 [Asparagus officinalis]
MESRNVELDSDGFDVIMVDLDSEDPLMEGVISAPPSGFVRKSVLLGARSVVQERKGVVVVNVISPSQSSYQNLLASLREVFAALYEIDVGNGENCVLIAVASPDQLARDGNSGPLFDKLKEVGVLGFLDHMKKI